MTDGNTRRGFLAFSPALVLPFCGRSAAGAAAFAAEPIIDIHQHLNFNGRGDTELLAHQRALGVTTTVLLPAGQPTDRPSTHDGASNSLAAQVLGVPEAISFARQHRREYVFGANEVPDVKGATRVIEQQLKQGARVIGEVKFGLDCDGAEMQAIFGLARRHSVPVLIHFQVGKYNHGFERFHKMLEKYPSVSFIGHAQTWWANIDKNNRDDPQKLYPRGPVTPGGLTDRYLSDYPNMYGDLSAGSGLNAIRRDEEHARGFIARHAGKLLFGTDCNDPDGQGAKCTGAQMLAAIRRLSPSREAERRILYQNAKKVFRL